MSNLFECVKCLDGYYMAEFDHTHEACLEKNLKECPKGKTLNDIGTTRDNMCEDEVWFQGDAGAAGGTVQASAAVANSTFALVALAFTALVSV